MPVAPVQGSRSPKRRNQDGSRRVAGTQKKAEQTDKPGFLVCLFQRPALLQRNPTLMSRQSCCTTEPFCLQQSSHLEQLEGPWLELMASGEPEAVATALRLFQSHLQWTMQQMQRAMVISEAEASLESIRCSGSRS